MIMSKISWTVSNHPAAGQSWIGVKNVSLPSREQMTDLLTSNFAGPVCFGLSYENGAHRIHARLARRSGTSENKIKSEIQTTLEELNLRPDMAGLKTIVPADFKRPENSKKTDFTSGSYFLYTISGHRKMIVWYPDFIFHHMPVEPETEFPDTGTAYYALYLNTKMTASRLFYSDSRWGISAEIYDEDGIPSWFVKIVRDLNTAAWPNLMVLKAQPILAYELCQRNGWPVDNTATE
jgi:hypothetical protein